MDQLKPVAIIAVNNDTKKRSVTSLYRLQELKKGTILYTIPEGYALVPLEITNAMQHAYFDVIDANLDRVSTDATFGRYASARQAY